MAQYKVGLVGLGEISSYFIHGVELNPRTELVAVCRRKASQADRDKYKAYKFYTEWKDLVNDPGVNCIIIATPPSSHASITAYSLSLKKKVIVEKPFSLDLQEAYDCVKLAQKYSTHLYFAYHAAFNPMTLQTKEKIGKIVANGDKISSFKVISKEDVRNYHGANSWIFEPEIAGGGCLIDSGVNAISVVENVGVGRVKPTHVSLGYDPKFKVEVSAQVQFVSAKDSHVTGEFIQEWLHTGPEKREITIHFKSGKSVAFDYATGLIITKFPNGQVEQQIVKNRENADVHNTPMAYEYINIVNDAVLSFDEKEVIDKLGVGPFETIMQCYELKKKSKL